MSEFYWILLILVLICAVIFVIRNPLLLDNLLTYLLYKRRWLHFCSYFIIGFTIILLLYHVLNPRDSIQCYHIKDASTLPDITDMDPRKGQSIFFHETSCISAGRGKITISSRQACAVESAAKMNPNLDVYLLYSSPGIFKFEGDESDRLLQALLSYKNIRIMHLDYEKYVQGTLVEELYTSGKIDHSRYVVSHASDILRFLTLWKYGGIYLDLDVIVIKSLEELPLNFGGLETTKDIGSAILSFDATDLGRSMTERALQDLKDDFNGEDWAYNGPGVITRLLRCKCGVNKPFDMVNRDCGGFTVYPSYMFYPLHPGQWNLYFDKRSLNRVLSLTNSSYVIHAWNNLSKGHRLSLSSSIPYVHFAKQFCPKVVQTCDNDF